MQNYNWNYPTTMWVGENRIKDLGSACKKLNINKPLLVTDNGLAKSKIIEDAAALLKKENLSEYFINFHIVPMVAAIWSMHPSEAKLMPLEFFINFFQKRFY